MSEQNIILNHTDILNKLRRIAYQIYETNTNEKEVILAGIFENGFVMASLLKEILDEISDLETTLCEVKINKKDVLKPITTSLNEEEITNKSIVLVDDVLNSGTTLIYGVKHFLNVPLKKFKTAVLVNRNHKKYPVKADFKGISLSTSLHEHVSVDFTDKNFKTYLS
jgi:pyrimidine operon attenuation protein / uracil phosphoribosyltransferase